MKVEKLAFDTLLPKMMQSQPESAKDDKESRDGREDNSSSYSPEVRAE